MFGPMLFWMQAQICKENGGIVTQVCTFIHLRRVKMNFQEKKIKNNSIGKCLFVPHLPLPSKGGSCAWKAAFSLLPLSQKHSVNNRKLHKQVLRLSVCLLGPYLAFKSVERSHHGASWEGKKYGGGSGALKFWKWVLAAFYQKLPTQKNAFTSHVIKCFCAVGNTIIYHLKSMPNKMWYRIDDSSRFQVMRGHTEMFLVLKITKDSKLFHVRIWSKKWFGSVMGRLQGLLLSYWGAASDENWWPLISSNLDQIPPRPSIVGRYCSEKADILGRLA